MTPADAPRPAARRGGNRLWRVETPRGPVLQKYYRAKAGPVRDALRAWMSRAFRGATSSAAAARWKTEGDLLALWRGAGIDVPQDLTAGHPHLAGERVRILEWVEGKPLTRLLAAGRLDRAARDALLARAAAAWGRRHALAAERDDPRLVQFRAGFMHLLVAGERIVALDFEQAYLPGRTVLPLLAREVAACLRSLAKCGDEQTLRADLAAILRAHPRPDLLRAAAEEALRGGGPLRRLVRALDPGSRRKARYLRVLLGTPG